jgi:undecaprenyl-diphosphatase
MTRDLERAASARFAFLLSIPIMLAAGGLACLDLFQIPDFISLLPVFLPGFLVAAIVGYLSIRWLLHFLTRHPLYIFVLYCAILGSLVLVLSATGY